VKILIKNAAMVYTFDHQRAIYKRGVVVTENNMITHVGPADPEIEAGQAFDEIIDATNCVVLPGLINTHHHFYQNVTRNIPLVHKSSLLDWLMYLYTVWNEIDEEAIYEASRVAIGELLLTGCTTTTDFSYIYPREKPYLLDYVIKAAEEMGIRMHAFRGCMPVMESDLAYKLEKYFKVDTNKLIEDKDRALEVSEHYFSKYHDQSEFSMLRIGTGPTTILINDLGFMTEIKELATKYNGLCHTHLHPREDEVVACREANNCTPLEYLENIGWLDRNTFLAHATKHTSADIKIVAANNTSVTHSPSCHMRLGYPVAPIPEMVANGVNVGIGVDGGASNDSGNMLGELRTTMMVHRIEGVHGDFRREDWFGPADVFEMATTNGARLLNRDDIGMLATGKAADIIMYDLSTIPYAGGLSDSLGALVYCGASGIVDTSIINGNIVVKNKKLITADEHEIARKANYVSEKLLKKAASKTGIDYLLAINGYKE
jgi:cytosine/adenosine deaminase-related metal-dependent hydrolase